MTESDLQPGDSGHSAAALAAAAHRARAHATQARDHLAGRDGDPTRAIAETLLGLLELNTARAQIDADRLAADQAGPPQTLFDRAVLKNARAQFDADQLADDQAGDSQRARAQSPRENSPGSLAAQQARSRAS